MGAIKLGRLPEHAPVKIMIMLRPDLARALEDYSQFYAASYGKDEPLGELIPAILTAFLDSDREFVRSRKGKGG